MAVSPETMNALYGFKGVANLFETIKVKAKLGEGYYVIGGHGFVVDAQGNTKQVL